MTRPPRSLFLLCGALWIPGCSPEQPEEAGSAPVERDSAEEPSPTPVALYERNFLFLGWEADTAVMVPWFLNARTSQDSVTRTARAWLGRGGAWELFFEEAWKTPRTPEPWRLLPHGPMRLVVGEGDVVERVLFDEGPRQLELVLEEPIVEWAGQRGEAFRALNGAVFISSLRLDGVLFDMSRARSPLDPEPGDWIFLTAGDSLLFLFIDPGRRDPTADIFFSGWARMGDEDVHWPAVRMEWPRVRSVDEARRDVPDSWVITAVDGDMRGSLESVTSHLTVGGGEGPLLPIDALFEVRGTIVIEDQELGVSGMVRHLQR
jgi:hypothetical protein